MVAWELLVGLASVAISIFFGLNGITKTLNKRFDKLDNRFDELNRRLDELSRRAVSKEDLLAAIYAFSKSSREGRAVGIEDLKEGYELARDFFKP